LLLKYLDTKHDEYELAEWTKMGALYRGGQDFAKNVGLFLPQNPQEADQLYETRKKEANYRSYVGAIIDYYVSWLFSGSFAVRAKSPGSGQTTDPDKFYKDFQEDVGGDVDICDFMRERTTEALVTQKSHWLFQKPSDEGIPPADLAEAEERGLNRITLRAVNRAELTDWYENADGSYRWIKLYTKTKVRELPGSDPVIVETWRIYYEDYVDIFELRYEENKRPTADTEVPAVRASHGFNFVPFMTLSIPDGMWVMGRCMSPQIEHFRMSSALGWLIRRTCYAMPVYHLENDDSVPVHGAGYYIRIGLNEKMEWSAPPLAPFDVIGREVESQRDEIYRIVHQMAQGLDNNADTVGRSADSKEIDTAATRIMLNAYGKIISEAIEEMFERISKGRGSDLEWSVEGFSGFDVATASQLLANLQMAKNLAIPSKTFHREANTKAAMALFPELEANTKAAIREELREASEQMDFIPHDPATVTADGNIAKADALTAKAKESTAKAETEPLKAKAAMKSASQPKASLNGSARPNQ